MKNICLVAVIFFVTGSHAQSKTRWLKDESSVRKVLNEQVAAWNRGDIEGFMQGYWKSDSLMFIGSKGVTHGWQKTLANYKKGYPDTVAMGKLSFDLITVKKLSPEYFFVVGKFTLKRSIGDASGHFDLLFRKVNGRWVIISDHTS
jgi:ketosteroid isomerase-like protein